MLVQPYSILLSQRAFRMEIRQERKRKASLLLGEDAVSMNTVYTDAQNLGVGRLETRDVVLEGNQFNASATCKIEHIKGKHNMLFALVVRQTDGLRLSRRQCEIRGFLSGRKWTNLAHDYSSLLHPL